MSVEFVDTNIFVYAHEGGAGPKHDQGCGSDCPSV